MFSNHLLVRCLSCFHFFSTTGGGEDPQEGQEEDSQQAVGSGEPKEKEGVCGWTGKQVRGAVGFSAKEKSTCRACILSTDMME